jgi:hypothetical protein
MVKHNQVTWDTQATSLNAYIYALLFGNLGNQDNNLSD